MAAQCALHPESPATGTCVRCGRFGCANCLSAENLCGECVRLVGDPYQLARAFDHFEAVRSAFRILLAELPRVVLITAIFSVPAALLQMAVGYGDDMRSIGNSVRATGFFELFIGTIGAQAMLALFIARGEGRVLTLGQAFNEASMNWNRAAGAIFRSNLWIGLLSVLLLIPGVWQAVMLMFSRVAALRIRSGNALDHSRNLVRGRFWTCLGYSAITFGFLLMSIVLAVLITSVMEELGAPVFLCEFVSDFITRFIGDALVSALLYVGFVTLSVTAGAPLQPMQWRRELPFRQPSQA